jgi:hypothetical protein
MNKIEFEEGVYIYQTNLGSEDFNKPVLTTTQSFLKTAPYSKRDNYGYLGNQSFSDIKNDMMVNNSIDKVIKISILKCVDLINQNNQIINKINVDAWINIVRTVNPKQSSFRKNGTVNLHNHVDIQKRVESFHPTYTYVYYIQTPNNLLGDDGVLIIGGKQNRYHFLPQVGDLVIMAGDLPHGPNWALNSTKDRIVIAGNVGFEYIKQRHSLI